ncbi:MAG: lamin tail domain-containing protein [Bacteroidales bacterium]|nr:lamin tail domain-containing protein [Bacteroidales bacterium]
MARLIKNLKNDRQVIFDTGNFDDWCVYVVESNGIKKAPYDVTYFGDLKNISEHYEEDKVYNDFVEIYNKTSKSIDQNILSLIDRLVSTYKEEHQVLIEQWFAVIYAGMIAEENKQYAILKKRIKRLGMHQTLKLGYEPRIAANFSKGKKWRNLDTIMKPYGF